MIFIKITTNRVNVIMFRIITLLCILLSSSKGFSQDEVYCLKLQQLVSDTTIQVKLLDWVDANFNTYKFISYNDVTTYTTGIRPGRYTLINYNFDWQILNFNVNKSQIKLLGLNVSDFYKDIPIGSASLEDIDKFRKPANVNSVDSIFFSEKSYYGILVKQNSSNKFINHKYNNYLHKISDRIGILCGKPSSNRE